MRKSAAVISSEDENSFWEKGLLGTTSPVALQRTGVSGHRSVDALRVYEHTCLSYKRQLAKSFRILAGFLCKHKRHRPVFLDSQDSTTAQSTLTSSIYIPQLIHLFLL